MRTASILYTYFFFFKQKTAYELRISDWSSDVCSSDLPARPLTTGETLTLDSARTAFSLAGGSGHIVLIELAVQPPSRLPIRAYDTAGGGLIHVSASRRDHRFPAMALTLLTTMGRRDPTPTFSQAAGSEDLSVRWNEKGTLAH